MRQHFFVAVVLMSLLTACLPAAAEPAARNALIIGVGNYCCDRIQNLKGTGYDVDSAIKIALAMGIQKENITVLRDGAATKNGILTALKRLSDTSPEGARSFIYFSGHGSRWFDPQANACVEGLLAYDGEAITKKEFASAVERLTKRADKTIAMFDACHSGGVVQKGNATRSLVAQEFTPKFYAKTVADEEMCSKPSNVSTRSLLAEATVLGGLQENFVEIASSRKDEISFDQATGGGVATQAVRDCLLGKAQDLDGSGAISLDEVQQCAQKSVDGILRNMTPSTTQHVGFNGNRNLIPVLTSSAPVPLAVTPEKLTTVASSQVVQQVSPSVPTQVPTQENAQVPTRVSNNVASQVPTAPQIAQAPATNPSAGFANTPPVKPPAALAPLSVAPPGKLPSSVSLASATSLPVHHDKPVSTVAVAPSSQAQATASPPTEGLQVVHLAPAAPPPALASLATLNNILEQRNPARQLEVKLTKSELKIGQDYLDIAIKASHDGYVYLVLLGSDAKSFYVLYPNGLDEDNKIKAGQTIKLPKPNWQIKANGPIGTDQLLVVVADSPRRLDKLKMAQPSAAEPFTFALNDLGGRAALINYFVGSGVDGQSSSFGAQLLAVKEIQ